MTDVSKTILEKYQVRKNGKQKEAFREYIKSVAEENGYTCTVEKGAYGSQNIVIGNPDNAKILFGAHYDTSTVWPFANKITPKSFFLYLLYQLGLVLLMFIIPAAVGFLGVLITSLINKAAGLVAIGVAVAFVSIVMFFEFLWLTGVGVANKHNANDNTSGVNTVVDLMLSLPREKRSNVAFVLFDLEEVGMIGSSSFFEKHKKFIKRKLLLNFDCVGDGDYMLFSINRKAREYLPFLQASFKETENVRVELAENGVFYPSDHLSFSRGVCVGALKETKKHKILYVDKIHTKNDTVLREENIDYLVKGSLKLIEIVPIEVEYEETVY